MVGTIVGTVLALEALAWMPHMSRRLVRRALEKLPDDLPSELAARWWEEIEADLESYSERPVGGLLFALTLSLRGGKRLAAELALDSVSSAPREEKASAAGIAETERILSIPGLGHRVVIDVKEEMMVKLFNHRFRLDDAPERVRVGFDIQPPVPGFYRLRFDAPSKTAATQFVAQVREFEQRDADGS